MRLENDVRILPWDDFLKETSFRQGEHVTLLGPTGGGKTTLAVEILPQRRYVVAFGTKRTDPSLSKLKRQGWKVIREWPPPPTYERVILWPKIEYMKDVKKQQETFAQCMEHVYRVGGWTVYMDEIKYLTEWLKLSSHVELLLQQGRSINLTVIGGTQRPRDIPLVFYSQATHLFLWRDSDRYNLRRLGELGAFDSDAVQRTVMHLPHHQVLYLNTRTGQMIRTKVDIRKGNDARSR